MVRILEDIEAYAAKYKVPIMQKDGIEYLTEYIRKQNVKNILEIGTAIGYSAIKMAMVSPDIHVVTIERDKDRFDEAIQNIHDLNLDNQIEVLLADALEVDIEGKFDLIFIDAAKAQYVKFFEKFKENLNGTGTIISDNLNFHGLTHGNTEGLSRNVRGLVRKINLYIDYLKNNEEFYTEFLDIGDGIGISIRK